MRGSRGPLVLAGWLPPITALAVLSLSFGGVTQRGFLLVAILMSLALPLSLKAAQGRLDLFEPLVFASLSLAVMFLGRPLADLATGGFNHFGYNVLSSFDETLSVALIGIVAFECGYASPVSRIWARHLPRPAMFRAARIAVVAWVYALLGAFLFWLFLAQYGGFRLLPALLRGRAASDNALFLGSTGYLYNGILLWGATVLLFLAVATVARRRRYYVWFLAFLLPLLIFYGARGTRSELLPLVTAIPTFWYLSSGRRPRLRTVAVVLLVGFSLLGWLGAIRTAGERGDVYVKLETALSSPFRGASDILTGADADMFDSLANELVVVPEKLPFQHGATITDVAIRAIPRPLWRDKPLESNDAVVNALWPAHYLQSRASPAFSLMGPFYADSGVLAVAIGMFLTGAALGALWIWFCSHQGSVTAQVIYAMSLPFVVLLMRGTIPDTLSRALFLIVPLVLIHAITRIRLVRSGQHIATDRNA